MDLDTVKALVRSRCWGMCEGCGQAGQILDVHHRQARQAGGVRGEAAEVANNVTNCLALCRHPCHDSTEHDFPGTEALGWRIPKWVPDPGSVPALIHTAQGRGWWILTKDAGYRWLDLPLDHRITWGNP